ncbi:hypothetical protein [Veillonella sp.]|uniref:hypothetical protein n=1 Tax=Veillonella sp. TaxID=1926307 RepID=UPI00290F42FD|nr:hypothetical protein [Veillonella sp.]MDU3565308.1 hypothetical protein [Veillonella sp.]MDU3631267.1 hypothetical protein [Veillonella sp.]
MKTISYYFNMIPLSFKIVLGFALICMIIISLMTVAAIINRPKQIQQLEAYEQKLTSISAHKVSENHYATGRNGQVYNFKITYQGIALEEVKNILSEEKINWREVNKSHIIGYDLDDNIWVDITHDINTKDIIVKLEKDR